MSTKRPPREHIIGGLVDDLQPIARPGKIGLVLFVWLAGAIFATVGLMLARAPFRAGFEQQLLSSTQFAFESIVGVAAITLAAFFAFRAAIPGLRSSLGRASVPFLLVAIWCGFYVYGLVDPALPAAMAGKREHCYIEVLLLGLPALAFGFYLMGRLYPLRGSYTGALVGLAAGSIPALLMQFGCMYIVPHILSHHIAPALGLGVLGAIGGFFILRVK